MNANIRLLLFTITLAASISVGLAVVISAATLRLIPQTYAWLLKSCFALGLACALTFAAAYSSALRHSGGIGITQRGLLPISILLAETGILGVLAFRSPFRFVTLLLTVIGLALLGHFGLSLMRH
jgi:hypothetical protein